jgi:hypothetical protein
MCLVYVIWILGMGEYRSAGWSSLGEVSWSLSSTISYHVI